VYGLLVYMVLDVGFVGCLVVFVLFVGYVLYFGVDWVCEMVMGGVLDVGFGLCLDLS